jgi:hypothetical protein
MAGWAASISSPVFFGLKFSRRDLEWDGIQAQPGQRRVLYRQVDAGAK